MWTGCRTVFKAGARIAIVGGGYIGLEVAAVGAKRGLDVTVFETVDRLMARAVSQPVSDFYAAEHATRRREVESATPASKPLKEQEK